MSDFQPTPAMKRLANVLLKAGGGRSVQACCKAARISAATYHSLMSDRDFLRWLNEEVKRYVTQRLWQVRLEHLALALDGNLQAVKLLYERYGESDDETAETFANLARLAAAPLETSDEE